jgi:hypothetical protein
MASLFGKQPNSAFSRSISLRGFFRKRWQRSRRSKSWDSGIRDDIEAPRSSDLALIALRSVHMQSVRRVSLRLPGIIHDGVPPGTALQGLWRLRARDPHANASP